MVIYEDKTVSYPRRVDDNVSTSMVSSATSIGLGTHYIEDTIRKRRISIVWIQPGMYILLSPPLSFPHPSDLSSI